METAPDPGAPAGMARQRFEIRPGVVFPDWSFVTSPAAEAALQTMFRAVGVERRWTDYSGKLDRVRTAILRRFAADGRGPACPELPRLTGLALPEARSELHELARRDLVVLGAGDRVIGAYPFTEAETGHSVRRGGRSVGAMCAIDALGTGAMLDEDVEILSACRACASPVRITTGGRGTSLQAIDPPGAVVWVGDSYQGNCGATSLCASIRFFCSDEHLGRWRAAAEAPARGHRLATAEAHQVGCAIFAPALRGTRPG